MSRVFLAFTLTLLFVGCASSNATKNLAPKEYEAKEQGFKPSSKPKKFIPNKLLLESCQNNSVFACYELGNQAFNTGEYFLALSYYDNICHNAFYLPACKKIALIFEEGLGVEVNLQNSLEIYSTACFRGDKASCKEMYRLKKILGQD